MLDNWTCAYVRTIMFPSLLKKKIQVVIIRYKLCLVQVVVLNVIKKRLV